MYVPDPALDEIGWSTSKSFRLGLGLEYFILSYFKLGLDYQYIRAPYDNFIFNFQDSDNYPVEPAAANPRCPPHAPTSPRAERGAAGSEYKYIWRPKGQCKDG